MNKRQAKKKAFKDMWLVSSRWKDTRKHFKAMERFNTYWKFYV